MKDIVKHFFDKVDVMQFIVGISVMSIFYLLIYALIYRVIPAENKEMFNHAIGLVEGAVMLVVGFYYGSSKGSAKKDEALKEKDKLLLDKDPKAGIIITPEAGTTTETKVTTETPKQ